MDRKYPLVHSGKLDPEVCFIVFEKDHPDMILAIKLVFAVVFGSIKEGLRIKDNLYHQVKIQTIDKSKE